MPRGRIYSQWPTVFRPPTDGVTALQFQQADGTPFIYVDTTNKRMGWGTPAPATQAHIAESSTASPRGFMSSQHSDGSDGARLHMRKSRGTNAAPTVITTGDTLGKLVASGYDGSNYLEMASISFESEGTIASTRVPTRIVFSTATDAAPSVLTERMRIDSAGRIGMAYAPTSPYVLTVGGKIYSADLMYAASGFMGGGMTTRNFQNSPITMDITNGYSFIVKINNAETGRFNSDGNFLIGTTTSSAKLYAYSNDVVAQPVLKVYQDNASNTNAVAVITGDGTGDLLQCVDGSTTVFAVKDGGAVALTGYFACNGATPAAQAAKTADATGTDAAIINAMRTCLINHGFMAAA